MIAIPFHGHDQYWPHEQRQELKNILTYADEIKYISVRPTQQREATQAYRKRNIYMVDRSDYVIAACWRVRTGSHQTINYARKRNKEIYNIIPNRR